MPLWSRGSLLGPFYTDNDFDFAQSLVPDCLALGPVIEEEREERKEEETEIEHENTGNSQVNRSNVDKKDQSTYSSKQQ